MKRFHLRFHLACTIIAALTCLLWSVITILVVFMWHTAAPRLAMLFPIAVLGGGAILEFSFYREEVEEQRRARNLR